MKSKYVDGFVIPLSKKKLSAYKKMAKLGCKIWMEYGALEYREAVGDDFKKSPHFSTFSKLVKAKKGETVFFSWVTYKSKAHRDQVNKKVMNDPRIKNMNPSDMPFDSKRMAYGGFKIIVSEE